MTEKKTQTGSSSGISRRSFLTTSAAGAGSLPFVAGPFNKEAFAATSKVEHYVPANKRLSKSWEASLTERGERTEWSGEKLNMIGMPVGGIAAGQMYLTGDGSLACWWIHNRRYMTGHGRTNYQAPELPGLRLEQGFAVKVKPKGKKSITKRLNKADFPGVKYIGEYPMNTVIYQDDEFPLDIKMSAYSPFIPLNDKDSSLPATIIEITLRNTSQKETDVSLAGWLENPVGVQSAMELVRGSKQQEVVRSSRMTRIEYSGLAPKPKPIKHRKSAPPKVFADFENDDYDKWKAEGKAVGDAPSKGAGNSQQRITGFQGKGLVNTYNPDDDATGKLTSPEFKIESDYINFLIGGGRDNRKAYMRLMVEGKEIARSTGRDTEKLAWSSWSVSRHQGKKAIIEIVDKDKGPWGHINVDQIEFADEARKEGGDFKEMSDFGTACFCMLDQADGASANVPAPIKPENLFWKRRGIFGNKKSETTYDIQGIICGALGKEIRMRPGRTKTVRFLLTWYFPKRLTSFYRTVNGKMENMRNVDVGNNYTNHFANAAGVARYIFSNIGRLSSETRLYHDTFYNKSTLPHWFLERVGHTPSILATGTIHCRKNGRIWGWEGVGCCAGTCTHVWNYEHAMARLFPGLERSIREMQDYKEGVGFDPSGLISFRGDSYDRPRYAADGQAGTVLKAYREHLISKDNSFLERNWPKFKKSIEYQMGRDGNDDGWLEDSQHNTYDINFYGPNPMIGSLYLAALRSGEEMAVIMGDKAFAARCRKAFESGTKLTTENLFNGEYFVQKVDWKEHPKFQTGEGCLSDQLFGQGWAHQVGLGYIYPKDQVRTTLKSVYKYNWTPDVGPHNAEMKPERWFARPGDAGLFTCTWPKNLHPDKISDRTGVRYRNEVWTGIEYQVAGNMLYEGLVEEGMAIIRGVHDRHDGVKHNPFNEVECGDHYARAMAAWGCLLGVCGFEYDGPRGVLGFSPKTSPQNFRSFFSGAEGWGSLTQWEKPDRRICGVEVAWGVLKLNELRLNGDGVDSNAKISVKVNGRKMGKVSATKKDGMIVVNFDNLELKAQHKVAVSMPLA
jgi:uncharacterized protein (DUF608 family)